MDALDGAASAVGSSVGMVRTAVVTGAGLVGTGIGAGARLVGTGIGVGAGLVGSGIGAEVGFVGSGLGAVGSGLSRARKFMGRTITGQGNSMAVYCLGFRRKERKINESDRTTSVFTLH
ncbi:hypothetical protein JHK82_018871 [Glycine max]|nr:hypothetical protein JHK85_019314 [Glycine max]KAG5038052.1 hypothetical protein JHK86_018892 [Glycine max]KAG5143176.1 hypothetical protein JHK82_018871 [Glycine max]